MWVLLLFLGMFVPGNDGCVMSIIELSLSGAKLGCIFMNILRIKWGVSVNYDCLSGRLYRIVCKMKRIHGLIDVFSFIAGMMNVRDISYLILGACRVMRNNYVIGYRAVC